MSSHRCPPPAWAVRTAADRRAIAEGYHWDQAAAERIIRFAEAYLSPKYTAGEFELFPWERRFLMAVYGWRRPDGGRRFRTALLHVPKKNGKTLLVSVIAAYELFAAGVASALVCSASTTKENAKQVFEHLVRCIHAAEDLKRLAKVTDFRKTIRLPDRDAEYRALSADAPNAEGLNCSAVIVDEAHAHRSAKLYRTLEYSMIGRGDGLIVVISTAGDDLTHWYYSLVVRGRNVLAGIDTDPTLYAEVYEADPAKDDLDDPAVWKRVNPSLDLYPGFTTEAFRLQWEAAKKATADRLSFERYRLNIFRSPEDGGWIDLAKWDAAAEHVAETDLIGRPLFLGLDGSQRIDPASVGAVWALPAGRYHLRSWAWVCEEGVREREKGNLPKYDQYIAEGCMVRTDGNIIDKDLIRSHLHAMRDAGHQVVKVVMDPNMLWVFGAELAADGFEVVRMPQYNRFYNGPTRAMEAGVTARTITHDGTGYLRSCVNAVRLDVDSKDQCRPLRKKSRDHIDGAMSCLMALREAMEHADRAAADAAAAGGVLLL